MSQNKHTPGPWEHVGGGDIMAPFDQTDKWYVANAYDGLPDGHHDANCNLIAAAPDLLEALELLIAETDPWSLNAGEPWCRVRAAISKARGDQ